MEATFANVAHVPRLNALEVRERGGLPGNHMYLGGKHMESLNNEPQGMSMIELRHLSMTGQLQVLDGIPPRIHLLYISQHDG